MNRLQKALAKLRRRSCSSKHEQDEMEGGRAVEIPHHCASSESFKYTPDCEGQDFDLRTTGGKFLSEKHCVRSKNKLSLARSWSTGSTSSTTEISQKSGFDSKKESRGRYNLIVDIGSGKDIPENETDVRPSFTFELIEDDNVNWNEIYQRKPEK